jgi:putative spermidine/putrescine transport system permease protein
MTWRANLLTLPLLAICVPYLAGIALLIPMSLRQPDGWGFATYIEIFARPDYLGALFNTFWIAFVVALISAPIGLAAGLFVARRKSHRGLWLSLILLPWVVSVVVRTYGWIVLISNRGLINWLLLQLDMTPVKLMFDPSGVIIGLVHVLSPFVALSVLGAALHQDPALEEAAASLGAKPARSFSQITLPLLMPGLLTGVALVFLLACGAVVTPMLLGGIRARMIGQQIYQDIFQLFNFTKASALSVILLAATLIIACVLFGVLRLWERGMRPETAR